MTTAGEETTVMTVGEGTTVGTMTAADMMIVAAVIGVATTTEIGEGTIVAVVGMTIVVGREGTISGSQGGGKTTASVTVIVTPNGEEVRQGDQDLVSATTRKTCSLGASLVSSFMNVCRLPTTLGQGFVSFQRQQLPKIC